MFFPLVYANVERERTPRLQLEMNQTLITINEKFFGKLLKRLQLQKSQSFNKLDVFENPNFSFYRVL